MSIRSSALKLAGKLRGLPSSPGVDIYTTSVTIRTRTWAGGRKGAEGGTSDSDLLLTPRPKVREIAQREIAGSGGRYEAGDVRVGPITPAYAGGGYTPAQLAPNAASAAVEILYVLDGAIVGDYMRVDVETDRALKYFLVLRRKRSSP